jgi:hypothetical protein
MVPETILVGSYGVFPLETALTRGLKITNRQRGSEMAVETPSTRQWL